MLGAEAAWVAGLLRELAEGTLSGASEWRAYHENGPLAQAWDQVLAETGIPAPGAPDVEADQHAMTERTERSGGHEGMAQ
jgi:hypothetical protein